MSPQRHWIELVQTVSGYTRYTCYVCDRAGDFKVNATNSDPITIKGIELADPATGFAKIAEHLTADRDPNDVAEHVDAAAMLVGLTNNIEPGVTLLAAKLPGVGITQYDHREDEE